MKYLIVILSLILCFASLASSNDRQFYRNPDKHFSIYFPGRWSIEKGRNPHVVVKSRSVDRIASIVVTITGNAGYEPITRTTTPEKFVRELAKTTGFDIELLTSEKTTFWNEEAMSAMYIMRFNHMNKKVKLICYIMAFHHLNKSFLITYGVGGMEISDRTAARYFDKYNPFFLESLSSFALEDWNR